MRFSLVLVALLALLGLAFGLEAKEKAHLIIKKTLVGDFSVQGKNTTINIEIFNAGDAAAHDIVLADIDYPEEFFELLSGSLDVLIQRIRAGERVTHSYVLLPKTAGRYILRPATIEYRPDGDSQTKVKAMSTQGIMNIITPNQARTHQALIVGKYISFGSLTTLEQWRNCGIVTLLIALIGGGYTIQNKTSKMQAERKRAAAQRELGVDNDGNKSD